MITKDLDPEQLPVPSDQRNTTDCCCSVLAAIFTIIMFLFASLIWNQDKLIALVDTVKGYENQNCKLDQFLYLNTPLSLNTKICVNECPQLFQTKTQGLCLPSAQKVLQGYWVNKLINKVSNNRGFIQSLFFALLICLGWGLLTMTFTHYLPKYSPLVNYVFAVLLLLIFVVFTFMTPFVSRILGKFNIIFAGLLVILAVILAIMLCMYSYQLKFQGYMMEYAVIFLNQRALTFIAIPLFLTFHLGLIALVFWQYLCFSQEYLQNIKIWKINFSQILCFFDIIQYVWALQFLKDACIFCFVLVNFCVSGNAVDWYWRKDSRCLDPYQRLICKNWGSVAGGSFLNAFFEGPTLIYELVVCHPGTCCSPVGRLCYKIRSKITCFFQLVRTDAYSYINLTGRSFCQSARDCSNLCQKSKQFVGYHSAMKHHRLGAHMASVSFVFFWAFWVMICRHEDYSLWDIILLIFVVYGNITWFIGIHVDSAEGLQTSYLVEFIRIASEYAAFIIVNPKDPATDPEQSTGRWQLLILIVFTLMSVIHFT